MSMLDVGIAFLFPDGYQAKAWMDAKVSTLLQHGVQVVKAAGVVVQNSLADRAHNHLVPFTLSRCIV